MNGFLGPMAEPTPAFRERYAEVYGSMEALDANLEASPRPAVRVNRLRAPHPAGLLEQLLNEGVAVERVPWWEHAVFLHPDASIGTRPEHSLGYLYGMDAASLLPALATLSPRAAQGNGVEGADADARKAPDPGPNHRVLDLTAAPGSKTGLLAELMGNEGLLLANDANKGRAYTLMANLQRLGTLNTLVTIHDGRNLPWDGPDFDAVLVDAPCTNLGKARPDWIPPDWTPEQPAGVAHLQRDLLKRAVQLLRPGGTLVYSTCTIDPVENEAVATWLTREQPVTLEAHGLPLTGSALPPKVHGHAIPQAVRERTLRIHPTDHGTEAFYLARFTKRDEEADA